MPMINYPMSLPTGAAGIERFTMTSLQAVATLRSPFSYATQVQQHPGQLWSAEVSIAPCKREQAEPWIAFLTALRGPTGTFLMGDPWRTTPLGTAPGAPKVAIAYPARTGTFTIKGWTALQNGVLKAGDYIQIGQRLHKVLNDCNSDVNGECNVDIFPTFREAVAGDTTIITSAPKGLFRLPSSEVSLFEVDKERLYTISFSAVEAI